eukprot:INCI18800.1.p1 GENE.INCI18800.1~~INCI18800.1.p1  ORF type:complete len:211 (+),score=25.08 INCI18800.1:176-808(+)
MGDSTDAARRRLLIPLPSADFDVTEVVVPWSRAVDDFGFDVTFATPDGKVAACDPKLLTGVIFGMLGASKEAIALYRRLENDPTFLSPISYNDMNDQDYDALLLPGGHAQGMKVYLEASQVQDIAVAFMRANKPVGAICHGPVVLARAIDPNTQKSVLWHRRFTALPKVMERAAYFATKWRLGEYYRTYPAYVQEEVVEACGGKQYVSGR